LRRRQSLPLLIQHLRNHSLAEGVIEAAYAPVSTIKLSISTIPTNINPGGYPRLTTHQPPTPASTSTKPSPVLPHIQAELGGATLPSLQPVCANLDGSCHRFCSRREHLATFLLTDTNLPACSAGSGRCVLFPGRHARLLPGVRL